MIMFLRTTGNQVLVSFSYYLHTFPFSSLFPQVLHFHKKIIGSGGTNTRRATYSVVVFISPFRSLASSSLAAWIAFILHHDRCVFVMLLFPTIKRVSQSVADQFLCINKKGMLLLFERERYLYTTTTQKW